MGLSTAYCEMLVMGTYIGKVCGVQTLSFKSAVVETGEDLMTDQIAGCIDESLGEANPLKRMVINFVIGGGVNAAKSKISAGKVTNNFDVIDATDAQNAVKNVDVTDAKNVIKNADITDAKNIIKGIDATDVKNAVKDTNAIDVTDGKYSLLGEMSEVDGLRYQEFQLNGSKECLTGPELHGLTKVDAETTLARVDYDDILSLRVMEAQRVKAFGGTKTNFDNEIPRSVDEWHNILMKIWQ